MPRNLSETDRKKNQFDKEERVHLLSLMKQYAPLLDKSTSTLARRKIWTTIENEFKKMGFTRKTSAQLKKYWQNYKYHCKKARALGKESKKCSNSSESESPEWNRYRVLVQNRSPSKFSEIQDASQPTMDHSQISPIESTETHEDPRSLEDVIDLSCVKTEKEDEDATFSDHVSPEIDDEIDERKEICGLDRPPSTDCKTRNSIVVSSAKISGNSVTVSVLYPNENGRSPKSEFQPGSTDVLWMPRERRRTYEDSSDSQNASNEDRESSEYKIRLDEFERRNPPPPPPPLPSTTTTTTTTTMSASVDGGESTAAVVVPTKRDVERNGSLGSKRACVFLTDYRSQLKHKLLLQQLEMEEKRLKVKIAELGVQEVQLRIKAVREDMRLTEELLQLNLARAAAGNVNF